MDRGFCKCERVDVIFPLIIETTKGTKDLDGQFALKTFVPFVSSVVSTYQSLLKIPCFYYTELIRVNILSERTIDVIQSEILNALIHI